MRTQTKAQLAAQRTEVERQAAASATPATPTPGKGLVRPAGEVIDGGDVEEIIHLDAGESITATYRGFKETKSQKPGETNRLHKIVMADGVPRGIWGTMQLNSMLDRVRTGDEIWLAYVGKEEIPGGKTMHNWDLVVTKRAPSV